MFDAVRAQCPELSAFVEYCYITRSHLYARCGTLLFSDSGVQQGDPLGPLLFSLAAQNLIKRIASDCTLTLNAWFLDDGTLAGSIPEVLKALELLKTHGGYLGLQLNLGKCELWWPSGRLEQWDGFDAEIIRHAC